MIEARRQAVAKTLTDAEALKTQADKLRAQYEGRIQEWEDEKTKARKELDASLGEEKVRRLQQIDASAEAERQKIRVQEQRKMGEERERLETEAIKQSAAFASHMLKDLASPELEGKLIRMALDRLSETKISPSARSGAWTVRTAFELKQEQREQIQDAIKRAVGQDLDIAFSTERSLLAGVEILLGALVIRANIRDELAFFSESARA